MRTTTRLFVSLASLAALGCGEDESVNGVFPASGFLGRTMRVEVTGDNTSWGSGNSLDFGPGITVSNISVASPTAMFAEIVISDTAAPGLRDVIVTGSGGGALSSAFQLTSPIVVDWRGTLAQGSVVEFTVHNFDFFAPFDDTCTAQSFFGCLEYGNVNLESPAGTIAQIGAVSPYTLTGTLFIDLDAAPGTVSVASGPADKTVISPLGEQLDITARTATAVTGGMTTATVMTAYETHLYEVNATANTVSRFTATTDSGAPSIYVLSDTGSFVDQISSGSRPVAISQAATKYYVIVADGSGESGFSYTLRQNPLTLATLAEADTAGANDTSGTAQNAGTMVPMLVTGGSITADTDEDWYRFTVPAGSTTKKVRVVTTGGDELADVAVEIYANPAMDPIGDGDSGYHENVTSDPIGAAGTIYVRIFTDPAYYDPMHTDYVAAIWVE